MTRVFIHRATSILAAAVMFPGAGAFAFAQAPPAPAKAAKPAVVDQTPGADRLAPSELEALLGPIALYPDPLLANVLAASVYPDEVAQAAKFIAGAGNPHDIDDKPWEAPVKAVAKIPEVIKLMGQYDEWTVAMGQAYLIQAKDVMDVVQSLRKKAQTSGALVTSPEQKIVVEKQIIYIKPADPEIIYVPSYNPQVVYVEHHDNNDAAVAGLVGFGVGIAAGLIIANNMDCNWHGGYVGYGWHGGYGGNYNSGNYKGGNYKSNNDITINGDVNIGNKNNTNINKNDVRNNYGNKVGNEGNAFAPNKSKSLASAKTNQTKQFKGGTTATNNAKVPGRGGGGASANTSGLKTMGSGANSAARQTGRNAQPNARTNSAADRSSAKSTRPPTPSRQASQGAFSGGSNTRSESQRGASSRSGGGSASRGGGGGGSRGGGGRGGGGGRR